MIAALAREAEPDMSTSQKTAAEESMVYPGMGGLTKWAFLAALSVFSVLFGFAALAPLSGGAIAVGTISPEGSRRVVQHLEGGIVSTILVRDGDIVEQGAPLISLSETRRLSERNVSRSRQLTLQIMEARLEAEQGQRSGLSIPFDIADDDTQLNTQYERQQAQLEKSNALIAAREAVNAERKAQIRSEIEGYEGSIESYRTQLDLIEDEIESGQSLLDKGLYAKPRLLALQREQSDLVGKIANATASIARLQGQVSELTSQSLELEAERQSELARQIADIRAELAVIEQDLASAEDVLERTTIRAPVAGQIVALNQQTIGGVVRPGETIAEIVPLNEKLIIEARIRPTDIDIVSIGQTSRITFSALSRSLPQVDGTVVRVAADVLIDDQTGMSYYPAEIEVAQKDVAALHIADRLRAGMPVDVMIKSESRTILQYLLQPLTDTLRRSLRETDGNPVR